MNIALCTDERFSYPCGVCVTSILENNKDEECNIYILTDYVTEKTTSKFKELCMKYGQKIEVITIEQKLFEELRASEVFPKSIYYRFLLPDLIKEDKVLYLDCDIIVTENIRALWNTDITGYACAAVEDQCGDDITIHNRIGLYKEYFNSGVLLMNLEYWRNNKISKRLIDFIYENPETCHFPDQDAMNIVLNGKVLFIDYKYNYQELFYWDKSLLQLHKDKWHKLKYTNEDKLPTIIHYSTSFKPWYKGCRHPLKDIFIKYKEMSPWKGHRICSKLTLLQKIEKIAKNAIFILRN